MTEWIPTPALWGPTVPFVCRPWVTHSGPSSPPPPPWSFISCKIESDLSVGVVVEGTVGPSTLGSREG